MTRLVLHRVALNALLIVAACGSSSDGQSGGAAAGTVELLAPGSAWKTLVSFSGKGGPAHAWGAGRSEFEFHAGSGALRETADGLELMAVATSTPTRFVYSFKMAGGAPAGLTKITPDAAGNVLHGMDFLHDGTFWTWAADSYTTGWDVMHYAYSPTPTTDATPTVSQHIAFPRLTDDLRVVLDARNVPWFLFGTHAAAPPKVENTERKVAEINVFTCGYCGFLRDKTGVSQPVDPFVYENNVYFPAYGETLHADGPGTTLSPSRLAILAGKGAPEDTLSYRHNYIDELYVKFEDPPIHFDDYTWMRSHVSGGLVYLTWIGGGRASQLTFDPKTKALGLRYKEVPVADFVPEKIIKEVFDSKGDYYVLSSDTAKSGVNPTARMKKLSPAGYADLGLIDVRPSDATEVNTTTRSIESFYLYRDAPLVIAVRNSAPFVEPQLSLLVLR